MSENKRSAEEMEGWMDLDLDLGLGLDWWMPSEEEEATPAWKRQRVMSTSPEPWPIVGSSSTEVEEWDLGLVDDLETQTMLASPSSSTSTSTMWSELAQAAALAALGEEDMQEQEKQVRQPVPGVAADEPVLGRDGKWHALAGVDGDQAKPFRCMCGRRYPRKSRVTDHKKQAVGFACDECGHRLARRDRLAEHKRIFHCY